MSVWVFLCIGVGIARGQVLPGPFQAIGRMEVARVKLPVGLLIWVMIIPKLLKLDFGALHQVKQVFVWSRLTNGHSLFTLSQVFFNSALAYGLNRRLGELHALACPSALIGASSFFELAVAAAIGLFGFGAGAALATVVGVLIEVPLMLMVVRVVKQRKGWYAAGAKG